MCYVTCLYVLFNALYEQFEWKQTRNEHYRLCADSLVGLYWISFEPSFIVLQPIYHNWNYNLGEIMVPELEL